MHFKRRNSETFMLPKRKLVPVYYCKWGVVRPVGAGNVLECQETSVSGGWSTPEPQLCSDEVKGKFIWKPGGFFPPAQQTWQKSRTSRSLGTKANRIAAQHRVCSRRACAVRARVCEACVCGDGESWLPRP